VWSAGIQIEVAYCDLRTAGEQGLHLFPSKEIRRRESRRFRLLIEALPKPLGRGANLLRLIQHYHGIAHQRRERLLARLD